jgi:hypothetical protein
MSKNFSSPSWSLTTIAAIGFCCAASQAIAGSGGLLPGLQAVPGSSPAQILPAVSNARPYRQVVFATCDMSVLGTTHGCVVQLDKITAGHLLQIDNINCGGVNFNATAALLFNTHLKVDAAHLVAGLPGIATNSVSAAGPYYFKQAEIPKFFFDGTSVTDQAFCSVAGTFWDTN